MGSNLLCNIILDWGDVPLWALLLIAIVMVMWIVTKYIVSLITDSRRSPYHQERYRQSDHSYNPKAEVNPSTERIYKIEAQINERLFHLEREFASLNNILNRMNDNMERDFYNIKRKLETFEARFGQSGFTFLESSISQELHNTSRAQEPQKAISISIEDQALESVVPMPPLLFDSPEEARGAYCKLATEKLRGAIKPIFVSPEDDMESQNQVGGETTRFFRRSTNNQSAFVILQRNDTDGWLFPNPNILFTEAMKYVFPNLSRDRFDQKKDEIEPLAVRLVQDGVWEKVG